MAQLCQGCLNVTSVLMPFSETNHFLQRDDPEICDEQCKYVTYCKDAEERTANHLAEAQWAITAVCNKLRVSAAMKQPYIEVMVAIPCWHFISVPVSALSLSSAPSGQRCTQLKTCNSLSGI